MKFNVSVKQIDGTWSVTINDKIYSQPGCNSKAVCQAIRSTVKRDYRHHGIEAFQGFEGE